MVGQFVGYYICNWDTKNNTGTVDLYENGGQLIDRLPVTSIEMVSSYHLLLSSNNECFFDAANGVLQIGQNASGQGVKVFS